MAPKLFFIFHCAGCGHPLVERLVCEAIGELGIAGRTVNVSGAGCSSGFCIRACDTDGFMGPHGRAVDIATAMKRVRPDNIVYTVQGDGDCIAIGAEGFINAAGRAERITVIMVNNTSYGTTGGQMAPTTLLGQVTSTTPGGRSVEHGYPMHVAELAATIKGCVYSARGSVDSPANYNRTRKYVKRAFQKQIDNLGFSFVEILAMCPSVWHMTPAESLKFVSEKMIPEFPLGEFKNVGSSEENKDRGRR
ncbi:MAG: 2-oxoglutarate oxidoreductase [Dehalococcoidia bacterium]|nr:2-oxoglutarate oxidoreductase [Dehalococcoidia bacterium]